MKDLEQAAVEAANQKPAKEKSWKQKNKEMRDMACPDCHRPMTPVAFECKPCDQKFTAATIKEISLSSLLKQREDERERIRAKLREVQGLLQDTSSECDQTWHDMPLRDRALAILDELLGDK